MLNDTRSNGLSEGPGGWIILTSFGRQKRYEIAYLTFCDEPNRAWEGLWLLATFQLPSALHGFGLDDASDG